MSTKKPAADGKKAPRTLARGQAPRRREGGPLVAVEQGGVAIFTHLAQMAVELFGHFRRPLRFEGWLQQHVADQTRSAMTQCDCQHLDCGYVRY